MNTYSLSLKSPSTTAGSFDTATLKALGYYCLFGNNVDVQLEVDGASKYLKLNADFNISLSNIDAGNLTNLIYDTSFQQVVESADKPYPIRGLFAVVAAPDGNTSPEKDMNDFIKLPACNSVAENSEQFSIYIGICNSSQTDFYTPFSDGGLTYVIMDTNQMMKSNVSPLHVTNPGGLISAGSPIRDVLTASSRANAILSRIERKLK